jgi:hypothetical protein
MEGGSGDGWGENKDQWTMWDNWTTSNSSMTSDFSLIGAGEVSNVL